MARTVNDDPSDRREEAAIAPCVNVVGEHVALGPLRRDLIPTYHRWNNDFATTRTLARPGPTTLDQETTAYDQVASAQNMVFFTVYALASGQPIGLTYLAGIDYRHRTAEFGLVIGEAAHRGKGHGTETTRLVLDYAFTVLGLRNVMLVVYEFNRAGRRAYEKAGFREFGRRHQAHWMGGKFWDIVHMECLASEFESPLLSSIFVQDTSHA